MDGGSLHFHIDIETKKIIDKLKTDLACSRGELTRRALRVLNQIVSEQKKGNHFLIRIGNKEKAFFIA